MCMEDFGKVLSGEECTLMENPQLVEEILDAWGCIQEASAEVIDELKLKGVPVLGGREIMSKLQTIANDGQWYDAQLDALKRLEMRAYGRDEYIERFMRYTNEVVGKASEFKVPLSLAHGDLNPANVAASSKGRFTFFDFEATCISYPMLDAMNFICVCNEYNTATFDDLWFYTQRWSEYESESRLKELFEVVSEIENLISVCNSYESWTRAEEGERLLMFTEMGSPVSKHFEAWEESKRDTCMKKGC
ncbi:Aminoglycoside phosphotransferase [Gracilaria domingensis]|nr:Aminoglycoside phosphotransferase [Gracilaria domingensis]